MSTVILLNKSKRLHMIDSVSILPTAAKAVDEAALNYIGVKSAIENGELEIVQEERDPILDKDEAEKDAKARKAGKPANEVPAPKEKPARKS